MVNKKILFIGIGFYDYDNAIITQFKKEGYNVDYFSEVPINTFLLRFYTRTKNRKKVDEINVKHTANIVENSKKNYDCIFIIKCENITVADVKRLREKSPQAKLILYLWDSIKRISDIEKKLNLFDKTYSFDRLDCESNKQLIFNPLFFRDEYNIKNAKEKKADFGIYHLGWYHSDRLKLIKKISTTLQEDNIKHKMILFTGYFNFLYQSFIGGELKGNKKYLTFKSISAKDNLNNILMSNATLDIAHALQSGLTMRTIELLGLQKKIITTNADIVNYDFYHPNNVMIIDRELPVINLEFFTTNYVSIPNEIRLNYSISNWLKRMLT
jgi:hypothetical protein